jgi:hypothetical protein
VFVRSRRISHRRIRTGHTQSMQQPTWFVLRHTDRYNMSWKEWAVLGGDPVCLQAAGVHAARRVLESKTLQTTMHAEQTLTC